MIGAIIGDIVGSRFEWNNYRAKDFEFFHRDCFFTDDSIMTLAVAEALLNCDNFEDLGKKTIHYMQKIGRPYPNCGYGGRFYHWMYSEDPQPYESFGNGAAMRVGSCIYVAKSLKEVKALSKSVTEVTHNHPEGLKGAEATAVAGFMAKEGASLSEIKSYVHENYYAMDFSIDEIRESYQFNETCQDTVPQALMAFFESHSFEDAIRNAISVGGDSDTLAAITGSVADAYYGVPYEMRQNALQYLDDGLKRILFAFERKYMEVK